MFCYLLHENSYALCPVFCYLLHINTYAPCPVFCYLLHMNSYALCPVLCYLLHMNSYALCPVFCYLLHMNTYAPCPVCCEACRLPRSHLCTSSCSPTSCCQPLDPHGILRCGALPTAVFMAETNSDWISVECDSKHKIFLWLWLVKKKICRNCETSLWCWNLRLTLAPLTSANHLIPSRRTSAQKYWYYQKGRTQ